MHLTVDALLSPAEAARMAEAGLAAAVGRLVGGEGAEFWKGRTMLVQMGECVALVKEGRVAQILSVAASWRQLPRLAGVSPLAVAPVGEAGEAEVTLWGYNLGSSSDAILARSQGEAPPPPPLLAGGGGVQQGLPPALLRAAL